MKAKEGQGKITLPRKINNEKSDNMFNEDGEKVGSRYTVSYYGQLFYGDSEGLNFHEYDNWDDVLQLIAAFGDFIRVDDNYYGVTWEEGGSGCKWQSTSKQKETQWIISTIIQLSKMNY